MAPVRQKLGWADGEAGGMRSCALGKQVSRVVAGARSEATVGDGLSSSGKEEACRQWVPGGHGRETPLVSKSNSDDGGVCESNMWR
eukprot:IDg13443t1